MIDDRIRCQDCRELAPNGRCRVAMRRERRDVSRDYGPSTAAARRCAFFRAKDDAEDLRAGRERFPSLWGEYAEKWGKA